MWWKKRVYLDRAAGASANSSSPHEEGRHAMAMLEDARRTIARLVEAQTDDVIFTGGATEANALAILGILKPGDHALYLPSAHASVVENMTVASQRGVLTEALPIKDSRVDTDALAKMLRPETALVAMDAVCGETGVIWNTREVAQVLKTHVRPPRSYMGAGTLLHVDASQAPLTEKIVRAHFGADLMTLDASKVSPVRGIGAFIAHRTIPIEPLYRGGGQERGLRPGSEAPELARAFAGALQAAARKRAAFRARAERDRIGLIGLIHPIPGLLVNEGRKQAPHILNISLPGRDTDYLVALLDEAGFAISTRSACETDSEEGSRAVLALTGDPERARATLRISWGPDTQAQELTRFAEALRETVSFVDNSGGR